MDSINYKELYLLQDKVLERVFSIEDEFLDLFENNFKQLLEDIENYKKVTK